MKRILRMYLTIFSVLFTGCASLQPIEQLNRTNSQSALTRPYVVMVSIDGYRYDYTDRFAPPALSRIAREGASAEGLLPVYPSKTFTNHYSIATGLYAENHGIVANSFYDPQRDEGYTLSNRKNVEDASWYGGKPLWVAAEQQGLLAANYFWPGSEAAIQGVRPTYYYKYNQSTPNETRVKQVKAWLDLPPEKRPHLIFLYFSDVDSAGHKFGPDSKEVKEAVFKVDRAIAQLQEELKETNLPVNLIIASDHGMQKIDSKKVELIDEYSDLTQVKVVGFGPQVLIYTKDPLKTEKVYQELKAKAQHFKVYKRQEIPARFHYSKNARAGDLLLVAEAPYSIGIRSDHRIEGGNHGFDPDTTNSMRGIFYAMGPNVKTQVKLKPFRNVNIYPWVMKILGLKILEPVDGNVEVLKEIYQE